MLTDLHRTISDICVQKSWPGEESLKRGDGMNAELCTRVFSPAQAKDSSVDVFCGASLAGV